MQQKLVGLQGETDESCIIVGDFNTPLSEVDRSINLGTNDIIIMMSSKQGTSETLLFI